MKMIWCTICGWGAMNVFFVWYVLLICNFDNFRLGKVLVKHVPKIKQATTLELAGCPLVLSGVSRLHHTTGVILLPTQTRQLPGIPQNYHTFALFDPPKIGNLMTPAQIHMKLKIDSSASVGLMDIDIKSFLSWGWWTQSVNQLR